MVVPSFGTGRVSDVPRDFDARRVDYYSELRADVEQDRFGLGLFLRHRIS